MATTYRETGFLLLINVEINDIDGDPIIYFGKYGIPQAYFPTDYWAQTISLNTPACRILTIASESRTLSIAGEGTGSAVSTEPVGFLLLLADVTVTGTPTGRTLIIEACKDGG